LGGDAEAHERVRAASLRAEKTGAKLADILKQDAALWAILTRQLAGSRGLEAEAFFSDPANYRGLSSERARWIADSHAQAMQRLSAELKS
jgi:adenylosuccinate lyase